MEPDFYAPYQGGYLPMKVIRLDVAEEGAYSFGLREVRMVIEAVSMGAPVAHDATPTPRDVDPLGRGMGGRALEGGAPAAPEAGTPEPYPGESWRWPLDCARCGRLIGPWDPSVIGSAMTHIKSNGAADFEANEDHTPVAP